MKTDVINVLKRLKVVLLRDNILQLVLCSLRVYDRLRLDTVRVRPTGNQFEIHLLNQVG